MRTTRFPEADLLNRSREGDQSAFGEIVERYGGMVRALAFSTCGDRVRSEDIAQETFLAAWRWLGNLKDPAKFRSWLCSIARQQSRIALRRESRRPEGHMSSMEDMGKARAAGHAPDEHAAVCEEERLAWQALERLPVPWREVLVLHYQEAHSTALIAEELGLSEAAVRQRLVRGRARLRERLAGVVEPSLRRGRIPHAALSATALGPIFVTSTSDALACSVAAPVVSGASAATSLAASTTQFAVMTKIKSIAGGFVLAALAGAPIYYRQNRELSSLRETVDAPTTHGATPPPSLATTSQARTENTVAETLPRTLEELRALWPGHASRRHTAALWRLAERLAPADLRRLLGELLHSRKPDGRDQEIAALLLERLGQLDPGEAARLVAALPPKQKATALTALASSAPAAAAGVFKTMSDLDRAATTLEGFWKTLAAADPVAAQEALASVSPSERRRALGPMIAGLSEADTAAAFDFISSLGPEELAAGLNNRAAVERLAAHDPGRAATLVDRLPMNSAAVTNYAIVAETWAAADGPAALAWAEGIEVETMRTNTLEALYSAWARSDPEEAFGALDRIADRSVQGRIFDAMTWETIERDPSGAEQWIRRMEGDHRAYALALLGAYLAPSDIDRARRLLAESIDANVSRLSHPSNLIARAFAERDPAAAAQWALTVPARAGGQQNAAEGVVEVWVGKDPAAASQWVATLPAGEARNGAIWHLIQGIRNSDPAAAFRWAASIEGDDSKRRALLETVVDRWTWDGPEAARAAVEALPQSEEREHLLQRL